MAMNKTHEATASVSSLQSEAQHKKLYEIVDGKISHKNHTAHEGPAIEPVYTFTTPTPAQPATTPMSTPPAMPTTMSPPNNTSLTPTMSPYFHFNLQNEAPLWFSFLRPKSVGMLTGLCFFLALAGVFYRFLHRVDRRLQAYWSRVGREGYMRIEDSASSRRQRVTRSLHLNKRKSTENATPLLDEERGAQQVHMAHDTTTFNWRIDILRGIWFVFITAVGYMLMLSVMTYNPYFFLALLVGLGIGEMLFGRLGREVPAHVPLYQPQYRTERGDTQERDLPPSPLSSVDVDHDVMPAYHQQHVTSQHPPTSLHDNNAAEKLDVGTIASADAHAGPTVRLVDNNETAVPPRASAPHPADLISPLHLPAPLGQDTSGTSRVNRVALTTARQGFCLSSSGGSATTATSTTSRQLVIRNASSSDESSVLRLPFEGDEGVGLTSTSDAVGLTTTSGETDQDVSAEVRGAVLKSSTAKVFSVSGTTAVYEGPEAWSYPPSLYSSSSEGGL